MKLIFRDIGQIQRFKCGVDPISAGITAGASLVGNIGSAIIGEDSSSSNVNKQLNAQRAENQKNRDWQTAEAEKNRNFQLGTFNTSLHQQTSEREAAQQFQSHQWQHQFQEELSHRFDVPEGVNPAVYFSSHGAAAGVGGSVSSPTTGSPSSPSGSMPSGVAGLNAVGYQPMNLQVPQLMSSLGSMMSGLANAKKAGVETDFLEKSLRDRLRQAMSNADMAQIAVALGDLDKKFQESTLPDRVKKVAADYKKVLTDIDLTGEKILTEKEEQHLKRVTSDLNDALAEYNKSAKRKLDIEILYLPNLIKSQILSNRGSAAAGFGAAEESHSSAQLLDLKRIIMRNTQSALEEQEWARLVQMQNEGLISSWQIEAARSAAEIAGVNASHAESLFWKDFIMDILQGGFDAFLGYRNMKSWDRLSKSAQSNAQRKIEQMKWEYGDKVQLEDHMPSGAKRTRTYRRPYSRYGDSE